MYIYIYMSNIYVYVFNIMQLQARKNKYNLFNYFIWNAMLYELGISSLPVECLNDILFDTKICVMGIAHKRLVNIGE